MSSAANGGRGHERPRHPATVVQAKVPYLAQGARGNEPPPHPATVVQPKRPHPAQGTQGDKRTRHPATVAQSKRPFLGARQPPHPATVAPQRTPHSATVAQAKVAHSATVAQPMDDLLLSDNRRQPNSVEWKGAGVLTIIPDHVYVSKIYLRGSWMSGRHQEILCKLERPYEGKYIRVSRTNGKDTFQYSAEWEHNMKEMPVLVEADPKDKLVAVGAIVSAFLDAHRMWEYYDQADCHSFAQSIFKTLTGLSANGSSMDSDEDSFM